jgi:hypothetical protein
MASKPAKLLSFHHKVTSVPKITTDLPFFNLTQNKKDIPRVIKYQDTDPQGRNIVWEVYPDRSPEIGAPGVEAHRVYHLLVKPSIDAARRNGMTDRIPEIIPLGGVRECLRKVGWSAGGRQARRLVKVLTQIAFAGCVADFHLPTAQLDPDGKQLYVSLKGRFSRMSVYAIGERHLSREELVAASVEFDPDETIYIRLDPLEAAILQMQDERWLDNAYLFSVRPAARRWYELVGSKVFGVVKHKGKYCDIRYSWYVKRHHTLKRYRERFRVVFQMNRVVEDHIKTGYLNKVEYFAAGDAAGDVDYVMRYYPGDAAVESTRRILCNIRPAQKDPQRKPDTVQPALLRAPTADEELTQQQSLLLQSLTQDFGVSLQKAGSLVRNKPESTQLQLGAWPFRGVRPRNVGGWIINAIEGDYELPNEYMALLARAELEAQRKVGYEDRERDAREQVERMEQAESQALNRFRALGAEGYRDLRERVTAELLSRAGSWARGLEPAVLERQIEALMLASLCKEAMRDDDE